MKRKKRLEQIKFKLQSAQQENLHLAFELNNAKKQLDRLGRELKSSQLAKKNLDKYIATKIEEIDFK